MTKLDDNYIVKVFGEIDIDMSKEFISNIIEISANPTQEITVLINSEGGCLYSMFAMHDIMKHIENPILTVGIGQAMSAAALLLAAGDRREIFSNTTIMLHEPNVMDYEGTMSEMSCEFEHMKQLQSQMYKLFAKYTGQTLKKLTGDLQGRDFYLTAKEAKTYGLVDSIRNIKNTSKTNP